MLGLCCRIPNRELCFRRLRVDDAIASLCERRLQPRATLFLLFSSCFFSFFFSFFLSLTSSHHFSSPIFRVRRTTTTGNHHLRRSYLLSYFSSFHFSSPSF
ncbi:hypothetical protein AAHE18_09G038800 [Arachis hypogaea]